MSLFGRDDELSTLTALLAGLRGSRGQVAVVTGPVACGTTALLRAFAGRAVAARAHHLLAVATRAEQHLPYAVLDQLAHDADLPPGGARRLARLAADGAFAAVVGAPADCDGVPARLLRGVCDLLLDVATDRPLVVVVDDIQHADPWSLRCLCYLAGRLRTAPVLLVLGETAGSRPATEPLAELLGQPHARRIELAPLPVGAIAALLAERLDPAAAVRLAAPCHRISGGNPLLAAGLVDDHQARGGVGALVAGSEYRQAYRQCLHRCEPAMLAVARGLAVLGAPASDAVLARILDTEVESVATAVDALNLGGLLDAGWFRHDEARKAVLDGLGRHERVELHARAARSLSTSGVRATAVARHLIAARTVPDGWVPVLHEAAEQALAESDAELAIQCLRLAGDAGADEGARDRSRAALARVEWRLDPALSMRHEPALTRSVQAGRLDPGSAITLAGLLSWFGRVEEAVRVLDPVAGSDLDADTAAHLQATLLWVTRLYPASGTPAAGPGGDGPVPGPGSRPAPADLLAAGPDGGADEATVAAAEELLHRTGPGERPMARVALALLALVLADRAGSVGRWCDELLSGLEGCPAPTWRAVMSAVRAEVALRRGDLRRAEDDARRALTLMPPRSWGVLVGMPLATLVEVGTARGRHQSVPELLRTPVPAAMADTSVGLRHLHARGRYRHAVGEHEAALADFERCGRLMEQWAMDWPTLIPWRSDAAWACLELGRLDQARRLVSEQLARLGPGHHRTRGLSLRVEAATMPARERVAVLERAVEALHAGDDQLELARALADLGRAYEALGQPRRARGLSRRGQLLAGRCGAELPAGEPGPAAPDRPVLPRHQCTWDRSELSEAERRVAVLAAEGHTNREIADRLYVTVSTVEQHLTRVYRKLKVRSRTDLPVGPDWSRPGPTGPLAGTRPSHKDSRSA